MTINDFTAAVIKTGVAIRDFLLRPFTVMWPFFLSMIALYVSAKLLQGGVVTLKDALPELYVVSLLLSFLKNRWQTVASWTVFIIIALLTVVEVFLARQFNLNYMNDVIRLMLESNGSETSQFLGTFVLRWKTLIYAALFLGSIVMLWWLNRLKAKGHVSRFAKRHSTGWMRTLLALAVGAHFCYSGWITAQPRFVDLLCSKNTYDFELRYIDSEENGGCGARTSVSRLIAGIKLYQLTTLQCDEILQVAHGVKIDSCDHTSPNIVLFLGESYIRKHAQVYGYNKATTPRLMQELQSGNLTMIDDALTVATQTSEVFKNMLSMHSVDQKGSWTSTPIVMQLMKLAGYRVSFITNQFALDDSNVWNSTGGFFLRNPEVSSLLLDYQSRGHSQYDDALLDQLGQAMPQGQNTMTIFHVRGQHVAFEEGYPQKRTHFTWQDYNDRTELNKEQKEEVARYDNCTLFQDSICGAMFDRFKEQDVVMVFTSDHGENVYDDGETLGRVHNDFSQAMIESQYQVPMWIWYSPRYKELHPEMVEKIQKAAHRPFQIDDMPHLILELAGVRCQYFDPRRSIINDNFNTTRKRKVTIKQ